MQFKINNMPHLNIPLTESERELVNTLEHNYDYLFMIDKKLLDLLDSKINSFESEFQVIKPKLESHRKSMEKFAKERSEIFKVIFIDRRTI